MSRFDDAKPYWMDLEDVAPRTSALAIGSLICGLGGVLICLPFLLPVAGLILGASALAVMTASVRPLRGRGYAITGLAFSLVFLLVHIYGAMFLMRLFEQPAQGARAFITALEQNDLVEARRLLTQQTSEAVGDEDLADLASRLTGRHGPLLDVKIDWSGMALTHPLPGGVQLLGYDIGGDYPPLPLDLQFASGEVKAAVKATRAPGGIALGDVPVRLDWLALVDSEVGVWAFPRGSMPPSVAMSLNNESWYICRDRGRSEQEYRRALALAQQACAIEPIGIYLNTLGVAQYRLGMYAEALETLTRADQLNRRVPEDVVFLAMVHYQLGDEESAQREMQRLRRIMASSQRANTGEMRMFVREAEELIGG